MFKFSFSFCLALCLLAGLAAASAQQPPARTGPHAPVDYTWEGYTFRVINNRQGQVYDANHQQIAYIVTDNSGLTIRPTVVGIEASKLRASFQRWLAQGGLDSTSPSPSPSAQPTPTATGSAQSPPVQTPLSPDNARGVGTAPPGYQMVGSVPVKTLRDPEVMETVKRDASVIFDLNLLHWQPELLDDSNVLKYFVALNNCTPTRSQQQLAFNKAYANELSYPELAVFYKQRATELLGDLPATMQLGFGGALLGEYDTGRKAFPIGASPGRAHRGIDMPAEAAVHADTSIQGASNACSAATSARRAAQRFGILPAEYDFKTGQKHAFSYLPMDPDAARQFIDKNGVSRGVSFFATISLRKEQTPRMVRCEKGECAEVNVTVDKIVVVKAGEVKPLFGARTPDEELAVLYP